MGNQDVCQTVYGTGDQAVRLAMYWAVGLRQFQAVRRAGEAVYVAVYQIEGHAVRGAVAEAVEKRGEPPHPGLRIYLGEVG